MATKPKVIMTLGLSGCGKTTWAKQVMSENPGLYKRVNKDDLRELLDLSVHSKSNEKFVQSVRDFIILEAVKSGKSVINDDTNLHPKHEEHIRKLVEGVADVEIKSFMDTPIDECIRRDAMRSGKAHLGAKIIRSQWSQYKKWRNIGQSPKPISYNENLPCCVIFDMDGTLALIKDRSPYDTARAINDEVNLPVKALVNGYRKIEIPDLEPDPKIFIVTGRERKFEQITKEWLDKHDIYFDDLFMRPTGNRDKDIVIKKQIYEHHIKDKYNVLAIFEDRNQVVQMYRELDLPVFQVADGDY